MISIYLCLILLMILWIDYLWKRRRYYLLMLTVPGPIGYPFIGVALKFMHGKNGNNVLAVCGEYFKKYGTTFLGWLGSVPIVIISEPKLAQDVLTSPLCMDKSPSIYKVIREVFGIGLVTLEHTTWSQHRKVLNPAFKQNVLISFMPIFNKETSNLVQLMDTYVDQGANDLTTAFKNLTLTIATQTTMGSNVKEEANFARTTLMNSYDNILELGSELHFSPLLKLKPIRQFWKNEKPFSEAKSTLRQFIKKMVEDKLENHQSSNQPIIFIDQAIKQLSEGNFSYKDVIDECYTIVFAAFETTYNSIYFALMLLAMFPQYQEKAFEELEELFPNGGDFDVTYEDIQKMDYLQRVLSEAMRLLPPIPLTGRCNSQDVKLSNGIVVPKGTNIAISIFHMHRHKDIWGPQAETFNPDHFLPQNVQNSHPYAYLPFLKGSRNCIGWRYALILTKITLAKLLRNFKFRTDFPYENLYPMVYASLKLKEVPLLKVERRI